MILGHEFTGEVVAAGPEVNGFPPGTRVVSGAGISCGRCGWCAAGRTNLCASYQTLGLHRDGGLAEFVLSPAAICRAVPDGLDDTGAAMAQPLAVALHAARRGRVGPGPVLRGHRRGRHRGVHRGRRGRARRRPADRRRRRRRAGSTPRPRSARPHVPGGAEDAVQPCWPRSGGDGAHVVIEASGAPDSPAAALAMVRRGGDVVIVGLQARPFGIDLFSMCPPGRSTCTGRSPTCAARTWPKRSSVLAGTPLARTVLGDVIPLGDLVEGGLRPLAERKAHGKIVVDVAGGTW